MNKENNLPLQSLGFTKLNTIFISIFVIVIVLGIGTGYFLAKHNTSNNTTTSSNNSSSSTTSDITNPGNDTQTFKDFAEGTIEKMPKTSDYQAGTNLLIRNGAPPVTLVSSVLNLNQYIGKKVKVYGQTESAIKTGWLMDVGKVVVEQQ